MRGASRSAWLWGSRGAHLRLRSDRSIERHSCHRFSTGAASCQTLVVILQRSYSTCGEAELLITTRLRLWIREDWMNSFSHSISDSQVLRSLVMRGSIVSTQLNCRIYSMLFVAETETAFWVKQSCVNSDLHYASPNTPNKTQENALDLCDRRCDDYNLPLTLNYRELNELVLTLDFRFPSLTITCNEGQHSVIQTQPSTLIVVVCGRNRDDLLCQTVLRKL